MERPMQKLNDLSRAITALEPDGTWIAVIEMRLSSWLVAGIVPGVERQPLKKLAGLRPRRCVAQTVALPPQRDQRSARS